MYSKNATISLEEKQVLTIDRIAHDGYQINITSIDAVHDRSMREVYGLDKSLRE